MTPELLQTVIDSVILGHDGFAHQFSYRFFDVEPDPGNFVAHKDLVTR